jgi:hypothetical protein
MDDKELFEKSRLTKINNLTLFPQNNMEDFEITKSLDWLYQNNVVFVFAPNWETCQEVIEESEAASPFFLRTMGFGPKAMEKLASLDKTNPLLKVKKELSYIDKTVSHITYVLIPIFTYRQFVEFLETLISQLIKEGFRVKRFEIDAEERQYKSLSKGQTYHSLAEDYDSSIDLFDRPFWGYVSDIIDEDFKDVSDDTTGA